MNATDYTARTRFANYLELFYFLSLIIKENYKLRIRSVVNEICYKHRSQYMPIEIARPLQYHLDTLADIIRRNYTSEE